MLIQKAGPVWGIADSHISISRRCERLWISVQTFVASLNTTEYLYWWGTNGRALARWCLCRKSFNRYSRCSTLEQRPPMSTLCLPLRQRVSSQYTNSTTCQRMDLYMNKELNILQRTTGIKSLFVLLN